jgi:hypothetical protein
VLEQLQQLACLPSRCTVGDGLHLGFGKDKEEGKDELDELLARQYFLCQTQIQLTDFIKKYCTILNCSAIMHHPIFFIFLIFVFSSFFNKKVTYWPNNSK